MQKREMELSDGAIALLGDDDFGAALEFGIVLLVDLFAEDEHDNVGILLDGAGFAQVAELRAMIAAAAFRSAAELRKRDDRDFQFFCDGFEAARDGGDFLRAIFEALAAAGHELEIIDDDEVETRFAIA